MPGIDFKKLRAEITMEEVLNLLGFESSRRAGVQWYGPCPFHASSPRRSPFSVNVERRCFHCHQCGREGNQLDLWAIFTRRHLHPASVDLCRALGREVPWLRRR
jgi:DNA primase